MDTPAAPVIYINGFPGVGKFTIAKALQCIIPNSVLIHNHQLIDPVEKKYPRGSRFYAEKRSAYRQKFLHPIAHDPQTKDTIYIFTDCQVDHNECVGDYSDLALSCNGNGARRFYSVVLECEVDENVRRLTAPDRGGDGSTKLRDQDVLREIREKCGGVWKFGDDDELVLDVTRMEKSEAAERITKFFERRGREGRGRSEVDI